MLKRAPALAASAALLMIAPAAAAEVRDHPKAVVELFTSQGCDSCPQADARLNELGKQPDVIALAYHVDYWDYIGWKDTFGTAANSERQKSYAQSWGTSRIYTPELVVNGAKGVIASHEDDVSKALGAAALTVPVGIKVGSKMLEVTVAPVAGANEAVVWLVTFKDHAQVAIDKGENAGKTMDYTQIVTGRQMLGLWDPAAGTHLKLPLAGLMSDGANGAAILIQTDNGGLPGPIVGAASVQL
jgi:hypothetical protein